MATSAATPYPSYYQPYQAPTAPTRFGYSNEQDPRKLAANQRSVVQSTGDNLMTGDQQLADQYAQQASGVEGYLNPIESKLAAGEGGYSPDEAQQIQLSGQDKAQIEYSPQDVNNIVNKAGISSGQATAASVNDAERAAAAAGGSPAALATYRARAAQTAGVNAGDAMTNARVAAKNAQSGAAATGAQLESAGGQAVGNARLGQQSQGLGYESNLQAQKNSNALSEQGLQQGAYGTQTSGTTAATDTALKASQTPSTFDKVIGGISGAVSNLADGTPNYMDDGQDAVVGENGMEAVIENAPEAVMNGASNPVRADTQYMYDGGFGISTNPADAGGPDTSIGFHIDPLNAEDITGSAKNPNVKQPNFLQDYLSKMKAQPQQPRGGGQQEEWNPTTPYKQAGSAIGKGIAMAAMLSDGDAGDQGIDDGTSGIGNYMADGEPWTDQGVSMEADGRNGMQVGNAKVFTKPTMIHLEKTDAVVPLTYRPKAKVRPSAAMPAMMAPPQQRAPQYV